MSYLLVTFTTLCIFLVHSVTVEDTCPSPNPSGIDCTTVTETNPICCKRSGDVLRKFKNTCIADCNLKTSSNDNFRSLTSAECGVCCTPNTDCGSGSCTNPSGEGYCDCANACVINTVCYSGSNIEGTCTSSGANSRACAVCQIDPATTASCQDECDIAISNKICSKDLNGKMIYGECTPGTLGCSICEECISNVNGCYDYTDCRNNNQVGVCDKDPNAICGVCDYSTTRTPDTTSAGTTAAGTTRTGTTSAGTTAAGTTATTASCQDECDITILNKRCSKNDLNGNMIYGECTAGTVGCDTCEECTGTGACPLRANGNSINTCPPGGKQCYDSNGKLATTSDVACGTCQCPDMTGTVCASSSSAGEMCYTDIQETGTCVVADGNNNPCTYCRSCKNNANPNGCGQDWECTSSQNIRGDLCQVSANNVCGTCEFCTSNVNGCYDYTDCRNNNKDGVCAKDPNAICGVCDYSNSNPTTTRTPGTTSAGTTAAGTTSAGTTRTGTTSAGTTSAGTTSAGTTSAGTTSAGTTSQGTTGPRTTAPGTTSQGTTSAGTTAAGTTSAVTTSAGTTAAGTTSQGTTGPVTTSSGTTAPGTSTTDTCSVLANSPFQVESEICEFCFSRPGIPQGCKKIVRRVLENKPDFISQIINWAIDTWAQDDFECMREYCETQNSELINCPLERLRVKKGKILKTNCACNIFECLPDDCPTDCEVDEDCNDATVPICEITTETLQNNEYSCGECVVEPAGCVTNVCTDKTVGEVCDLETIIATNNGNAGAGTTSTVEQGECVVDDDDCRVCKSCDEIEDACDLTDVTGGGGCTLPQECSDVENFCGKCTGKEAGGANQIGIMGGIGLVLVMISYM